MKAGDYIIGITDVKGSCKKDARYKIIGILEEGQKVRVKGLNYTHTLEEDYYLVKHSSRTILSRSSNFEYDYKYNRKIKLKKINKL